VLVSAGVGEKAPGITLPTDRWENGVSLDDYMRDGPVALEAVLEDLDRAF
jgi:hypothetical protein